jgi:hypothetical protein
LLGAKIDIDFGSKEYSLVTGRHYANENYSVRADVLGISLGFDAARNVEIYPGQDRLSISYILSGHDFDWKPAIETHSLSSKEFWTFYFGMSLGIGVEGNLDFSPYVKSTK